MKTTLEFPDDLMTAVKHRAERKGSELKDEVVDLLRKGLAASGDIGETLVRPSIRFDATGFPYVECPHAAPPGEELTPDRLDEILLEQEVARLHEAG